MPESGRLCPDCDHDDPHTTPVDGQYIRCGTCIREGRDAYTLCTRFPRNYARQEKAAPAMRRKLPKAAPSS